MSSETIAKNIRYLRKRSRMTQKEMANMFNVTRGQFSSYEKGTSPGMGFIVAFAKYFNISVEDLYECDFSAEGKPYPKKHEEQSSVAKDLEQKYIHQSSEYHRAKDELITVLREQLQDKEKMIRLLEEKIKMLKDNQEGDH
jgi:transcriptional regulator with XRE-family HTH domain